jgi:hypothetical protein
MLWNIYANCLIPCQIALAEDSVGKENAMNLSDHASSESDGDTDAMCGNVLPITNCMEYLHSYSTPIINEDQLMKTKSSKLKDNEHCESVMNVTNDENYTDGLLGFQLPVQSVPITTKVVSSNPVHGEENSMQHYVIKFVSDLQQVGSFLRVL